MSWTDVPLENPLCSSMGRMFLIIKIWWNVFMGSSVCVLIQAVCVGMWHKWDFSKDIKLVDCLDLIHQRYEVLFWFWHWQSNHWPVTRMLYKPLILQTQAIFVNNKCISSFLNLLNLLNFQLQTRNVHLSLWVWATSAFPPSFYKVVLLQGRFLGILSLFLRLKSFGYISSVALIHKPAHYIQSFWLYYEAYLTM